MQSITDKMVFKLPDFMSTSPGRRSDGQRPHPLKISRSFSRVEPSSPERSSRPLRASTIQNGALRNRTNVDRMTESPLDAFEKTPDGEASRDHSQEPSGKLPAEVDELPIELASLSDR